MSMPQYADEPANPHHERFREHLRRGLYADYVDGMGLIVDHAWRRAVGAQSIVGTCRRHVGAGCCDGYLRALQPYDLGKHRWYEAECMKCGHAMVAPHGKVLLHSSRASEQPDAMAGRREQWKSLADMAKAAAA